MDRTLKKIAGQMTISDWFCNIFFLFWIVYFWTCVHDAHVCLRCFFATQLSVSSITAREIFGLLLVFVACLKFSSIPSEKQCEYRSNAVYWLTFMTLDIFNVIHRFYLTAWFLYKNVVFCFRKIRKLSISLKNCGFPHILGILKSIELRKNE